MKVANRHKQLVTGTSTATLSLGAAIAGFRTLSKVITNGASDPMAVKVGDTNVPFIVDDGAGNWLEGMYTVTSATQLTRTSILDSSADGADVTLTGSAAVVYSTLPAQFVAKTITTDDAVTGGQLGAAGTITKLLGVDGSGSVVTATAGVANTFLGSNGTTGSDTTPPTFVSAQVANSTPTVVQVTMSETLGATAPPASALAVSKNGGAVSVSSVTTSGAIMLVTVASPFVSTDSSITVTYTKPSNGNMLTDAATTPNAAASFGPAAVTNNVAAAGDTTAPTASSAAVANATPSVVAISMSESLDAAYVPAASAFTVGGHTVSSVAVSGATINLTLSAPFVNGEAARTVAYTQPGTNNARDLAGNLLANFTGLAITNNVQAQAITVNTPSTQTSGQAFTVTGTYANGTPSALDYRLSDDTAGQWTQVTTATISGGTYSFSIVAGSATAGRTISVRDRTTLVSGTSGSYVVNAAGPVFHFDGNYSTLQSTATYGASSYASFANALYIKDASNNGINFSTYDVYLVMHNSATVAPTNSDSLHATHSNTYNLCTNPGATPGLASGNSIFVYKDTFPAGTYYTWAIVVAKGAGQTGTVVWQKAYDGVNTGTAVPFTVSN